MFHLIIWGRLLGWSMQNDQWKNNQCDGLDTRNWYVVNSSKTEVMYFSKNDQDGLKINVAPNEITVGKTMRVLIVMFDSRL